MQFEISKHHVDYSTTLGEHAKDRVMSSLRGVVDRIERVAVRFADAGGPETDRQVRCLVEVRLARRPEPIIADATGTDAYGVAETAASRIGRRVRDLFDRRRSLLRRPG